MAVGAGGIWVTDRNGPTVLRIDPVTGQINLRVRLSSVGLSSAQPNSGTAIDAGSLWVARGPEAVDRLNPSSLKLQRRIMLNQHGCSTGERNASWQLGTVVSGWQEVMVDGWPESTRRPIG